MFYQLHTASRVQLNQKQTTALTLLRDQAAFFFFSLGKAHRVISMASEHCAARVIETDSSARKQEQEG